MQSIFKRILASAAILGAMLTTAQAGVITTLYSTGVDDAGNLLANGATDTHYTVVPGSGPFVIGSPGSIGWVGNTSGSQWISAAANTFAGPGPFTYTTTFDLTGFDFSTASIQGQIASDNEATIWLNGVLVGSDPFPGWTSLVGFSITSGFQAGINTLAFVVPNNRETANDGPTGLQVRITSATAAVPEPATLALVAVALTGLAWARRRRTG